jgi:bis(5'-nucleosyl)-tetraphosphatase (symmetrical)
MTTYAIGDIQGCFQTFLQMLETIGFIAGRDDLILLGDLVNRGPQSLEVMRFVKKHSSCIRIVLGNHDLYGLALHLGAMKPKPHTLDELLKAPDAKEIFSWVREQPVIFQEQNDTFVHAGILPTLSIAQALNFGSEISDILKSVEAPQFISDFLSVKSKWLQWSDNLPHADKLKAAMSGFIFLRMCESALKYDGEYTDELSKAPAHLTPWFRLRSHDQGRVFFGHWAALGAYQEGQYFCLDSGCVWGKQLTAMRLYDGHIFSVENQEI